MKFKKAQAALEFLTTYGWAFLVILVMIGALAYFGVLNPERFVQEKCFAGATWQCSSDAMLADSGDQSITIELSNLNDDQWSIITDAGSTDRPTLIIDGVDQTAACTWDWYTGPAGSPTAVTTNAGDTVDLTRKQSVTVRWESCPTNAVLEGDTLDVEVGFTAYATTSTSAYAKDQTIQATMRVQ